MPIVRLTDLFGLGCTQGNLDFVNVDVNGDTPLFIDPQALKYLRVDWAKLCVEDIQNFFSLLMTQISKGDSKRALEMLSGLREPNETHLGLSTADARGRTLGPESANDLLKALLKSKAARSGVLTDLEDTALMIDGIGPDIISDITTNIIRSYLIAYTQEMSRRYNIPVEEGIDSGPLWNSDEGIWESEFTSLPMGPKGKILLVP
ncbi:MAG: hypothetical protein EOP04_24995, partial [Proteobacteria bacterium]